MLRSKSSRCAFSDLERESNDPVLSRTSSPRSYRGDNLGNSIDWNAHKSFQKRRSVDSKPKKISDSTESQRPLSMQEHIGKLQEELKRAKDLIFVVEEERKRAVDDMKEAKRIAHKAKASETLLMNELSVSKKKIEELQDEVEARNLSETKMLESLQNQTEQLQQANLDAKKSKVKITSLSEKILSLEASLQKNDKVISVTYTNKFIPCAPREMKMFSELDEVESLRYQVTMALQAEAKSERALYDLALVLKEVASESNEAKEKVRVKESELENAKAEVEQLKQMIRSSEEKYEKLLEDVKRESDKLKREAEESHLTWKAKEMGFISCIKRTEEEKAVALHENNRLMESLKQAEHSAQAAREMEEAMKFLVLGNEGLMISETAASENMKYGNKVGTINPSLIAVSSHEQEKKMWKNTDYDIEVLSLSNDSEDSDQIMLLKDSLFDSDASP